MVDSITPLPPINSKVTKPQVAEKNPHHQNEKKRKHKDKHEEEEVRDEVVIEGHPAEDSTENKSPTPPPLSHKIDIEV